MEHKFDPGTEQDPARALTLAIRGLRMGDRVTMADGTVVRSITIRHGSSLQRRFAVVPPEGRTTALQRHRLLALNHRACKTAQEAAERALSTT